MTEKKDKLINLKGANSTMKLGLVLYAAIVVALIVGACHAYAAGDPISTVNKLSEFIFSLIRAIGLILLGLGIMQVGLSLKSHDPSQRANDNNYLYKGNPDYDHRLIEIPVRVQMAFSECGLYPGGTNLGG